MKDYELKELESEGFVKLKSSPEFYETLKKIKVKCDSLFPSVKGEFKPKKTKVFGRAIKARLDYSLPNELNNLDFYYGKRIVYDIVNLPKEFAELVENSFLINIAKKALKTDKVVLHNGSLSSVYPGDTGNATIYHSDTVNFCGGKKAIRGLSKNKNLLNIMILMDNVDSEKAPMKILKKSHLPILHEKINKHVSKKLQKSSSEDNLSQENWIYKELLEDFNLEETSFEGEFGDVGLMNTYALHRATENKTNFQRKVIILNYGRLKDTEHLRKYPYFASKKFISYFSNKEIIKLSYKKSASLLFKLIWKSELYFTKFYNFIIRQVLRLMRPSFIISRLYVIIIRKFEKFIKFNRSYINLGGGPLFKHPQFYTLDVNPLMKTSKKEGFIEFNLVEDLPLPFDTNSIKGIYTSHCMEHLSRNEVIKVLKDSLRVLEDGMVMRIVVPDMKAAFNAFDNRNASYFEWIRAKQDRPNQLWKYDSWLRLVTRSFAGHVVDLYTDEELEKYYYESTHEHFIEKILSIENNIPSYRFVPNTHKSAWSEESLKQLCTSVGFKKVLVSSRGNSYSKVMRNRTLFDITMPNNSIFIDAIK